MRGRVSAQTNHSTDNILMEVCTVANNGKKVVRIMKIQFPAGGAKPGPALAGAGIQMPKLQHSTIRLKIVMVKLYQ